MVLRHCSIKNTRLRPGPLFRGLDTIGIAALTTASVALIAFEAPAFGAFDTGLFNVFRGSFCLSVSVFLLSRAVEVLLFVIENKNQNVRRADIIAQQEHPVDTYSLEVVPILRKARKDIQAAPVTKGEVYPPRRAAH